jgi:hypothetical protein
MNIPDYCDALTAYRAWDVKSNGLLVGQHVHETWPPYEAMQARCTEPIMGGDPHLQDGKYLPAPIFKCGCGVHAHKTIEATRTRLRTLEAHNYFNSMISTWVWGTVKLWGRVIEHEHGYRAEYAYPADLCCETEGQAKRVSDLYGVPCHAEKLPQSKSDPQSDWLNFPTMSLSPSIYSFWRNQQIYRGSIQTSSKCSSVDPSTGERCDRDAGHGSYHQGATMNWDDSNAPSQQNQIQPPPQPRMSVPQSILHPWERRMAKPRDYRAELEARQLLAQMVYMHGFDPAKVIKP